MKIALTAESTIDLPHNLLEKYKIQTIPFYINMGDETFPDEEGISKKIYQYVDQTKQLPKTAAVNRTDYEEFFTKILKNYQAIIHISLSSEISSAYQNAYAVATNMPNVFVIDSKQLSTGIALLAIYARKLIDDNLEAYQVADLVTKKTTSIQTGFVLENLQYLHKGGRCSAMAKFGANLLKIKPQIAMINGKLILKRKFSGPMNKVVEKYFDALMQDYPAPNLDYVFITHSSEMPEAVSILTEKLKNRGFKTIYDTFANGTISSHCGPNCIGVLFDGGKESEPSN